MVDVAEEDIRAIMKHGKESLTEHRPVADGLSQQVSPIFTTKSGSVPKIGLKKDGISNVPNIVKAWRNGKLDWHSLLAKHNSWWERFGTPKGEGKLPLLVNKEVMVTDYLTRFKESGLSAMYGKQYGSLQPYSGCNVFQSSCMIHDQATCGKDHLCRWDTSRALCVDAWDGKDLTTEGDIIGTPCAKPKILGDGGFEAIRGGGAAKQCKIYVNEPAVSVTIDSESQSMFYHWWASWSGIVQSWMKELGSRRDVHFYIPTINDPMFFQFFGLLSDNCWRRSGKKYSPANVCYCDTKNWRAAQSRVGADQASAQMLEYLQLSHLQPPEKKVRVGLISRRRKRFILNEYELVQAVEDMGYECVILPLEVMTLYEQMEQLRSIDVLIGIHGSALDNSVFLHKGSVLVQLLPYTVEHKCTFQSTAEKAGVHYMEWTLKERANAVFHWDLLQQANANALASMSKEDYLRRGQRASDSRETLMFWINQDIIVPLNEWKDIVHKAVRKSTAAQRGLT